MKEDKKTGSCFMATIWFILSILYIYMPISAILNHYHVSHFLMWLLVFLLEFAFQMFPLVMYAILHLLVLAGVYFIYTEYPKGVFIFYIVIMAILFLRTILFVLVPFILDRPRKIEEPITIRHNFNKDDFDYEVSDNDDWDY